jgi:hypothetical protein
MLFFLFSGKNPTSITGLGIKTASYLTNCKETPPSWNKIGMFLLEMTENQMYYLTRSTIFRFVRYYVACTTISYNKSYSELATRSGAEFL